MAGTKKNMNRIKTLNGIFIRDTDAGYHSRQPIIILAVKQGSARPMMQPLATYSFFFFL